MAARKPVSQAWNMSGAGRRFRSGVQASRTREAMAGSEKRDPSQLAPGGAGREKGRGGRAAPNGKIERARPAANAPRTAAAEAAGRQRRAVSDHSLLGPAAAPERGRGRSRAGGTAHRISGYSHTRSQTEPLAWPYPKRQVSNTLGFGSWVRKLAHPSL